MIKFCKDQWNANKERLEAALRDDTTLNNCDYKYLLYLVVNHILNPGAEIFEEWSSDNITVVDNGDYQGTLMFLIPRDIYQPSANDYLMTFVEYGSCSVCDALMSIQEKHWHDGAKPTDEQLKDYMTLCKDLVMNMIRLYNYGWRYDKKYAPVEEEPSEIVAQGSD